MNKSVAGKPSTPTINVSPNVIREGELKEVFNTVFGQMADIVAKTYGPFGANTAYQVENKVLTTKDGWSVEQSITYPKSFIASLVRRMILDVSLAINSKSGDGTSTGLIAAYEVNRAVMEYLENHRIHSKFLTNAITCCVDKICSILEEMATPVTEENLAETIYRIALVSLDWDTEFAGYIRDIYTETKNPIIRVQDSGTESSSVEYREGYDLAAKIVSEFKVNNLGEKKYTVEKPLILIFTYTLNASMFEPIVTAATFFANSNNQELVVMAPDFEKGFRDNYNALCIRLSNARQPLPNFVMVRYFAEFNIEREMLNDFCFLTGANLITKDFEEGEEIIREFVSATKQLMPIKPDDKVKGALDKWKQDMEIYRTTMTENGRIFYEKIGAYLGSCEEVTIDEKLIVAKGFDVADDLLEQRRKTITASINKLAKDMNAKSMLTDEVALKKNRLGKLRLKYGVINVGGFGEGYLKSKKDALDDAINACTNAYNHGVIVGGGIAIPMAVERAMDALNNGLWDPAAEKGVDISLITDILNIIEQGFIRTTWKMMENRYPGGIVDDIDFNNHLGMKESIENIMGDVITQEKTKAVAMQIGAIAQSLLKGEIGLNAAVDGINQVNEIGKGENVPGVTSIDENLNFPVLALITYCMTKGKPWNLITGQLDETIIHPVKVETEVIRGCLHLVLVATTTNQMLYSGYDGIEEELKEMREVKE